MQPDFQLAIGAGDTEAVRALLDSGTDVNTLDRFGQSGLMRASMRGHADLVRLLIERGADLDIAAKYHLTALMLAVVNHHEDIAIALIEADANLECEGSGAPGFAGLTALDLARARGLEATVTAIEARSPSPVDPGTGPA